MAWKQSVTAVSATPTAGTFSPALASSQTVLLVYGWGDAVADTATITDNAGNSYTKIGMPTLVNNEYWGIAYCLSVTGTPSTITMTTGSAHTTGAIIADVYDGEWTFFQSSTTTATGIVTMTLPAITPLVNGSLIYGTAVETAGTNIVLHAGSFTPRVINFSGAWSTADFVQSSAAPISVAFDISTAGIGFEMVLQPFGSPTLMGAMWQ